MVKILSATQKNIEYASTLLRQGELVGIPTETVYGLAANAFDYAAVAKIFKTKNRPYFNPLIVHFKNTSDVLKYFTLNKTESLLAETFWPGPLTLILKKDSTRNSFISSFCSYGLETQAVRVPNNKITLNLLNLLDFPLAAPSANKSNMLSPTLPEHVKKSLQNQNLIVLDGGKTVLGVESTIVEVIKENEVNILRYGNIVNQDFEKLHLKILNINSSTIKSPGLLKKHYSPNTPIRLNATSAQKDEALLAFGKINNNVGHPKKILNLSENADLIEASSNLFSMLWELDDENYKQICIMPIPNIGIGIAINERLLKASIRE